MEYGAIEHESTCSKKARHSGHDYRGFSESHWEKTLSDAKNDAIEGLKISLKKDLAVAEETVQVKKTKLNSIITVDKSDRTAIGKLIDEMTELEKEILQKRYEHMIKVREILTPEQRDSYDMRILAKSRWERGDD
ncbi:MAG TPA: hypothetical protein DDX84_10235 [Nitrospiraceae bacterium]|nr:hypothetical protein [Nitrospiraceae bacterium]HBI24556.1 hypothetical protein [Nitrospiraceae bacterium]